MKRKMKEDRKYVVVAENTHTRIKISAAIAGISMQELVETAITQYLERGKNGSFENQQKNVEADL